MAEQIKSPEDNFGWIYARINKWQSSFSGRQLDFDPPARYLDYGLFNKNFSNRPNPCLAKPLADILAESNRNFGHISMQINWNKICLRNGQDRVPTLECVTS